MITVATEYWRNLYRIQQDHNLPSLAVLLPSTENIYEIDLNTRKITPPEYLSVYTDHAAEVIYFKCDRFFDYMDLANCNVVIQYKNAKGESRLYAVPFVDVATCSLENKMLIPWCVDGNVTAQAGEVTFSIRFYKIDIDGEYVTYNLSTLPVKTKVLEGMNVIEGNPEPFELAPSQYEYLVSLVESIPRDNDLEWIVL
jgi:hypothetical protein